MEILEKIPAFVRISGPPNSNLLIGYPGISATMPRIEGKVEIRPGSGYTAPVAISFVSIALYRRETIHPHADGVISGRLAAPRKEINELVAEDMRLYQCPAGMPYEMVMAMDLPFMLLIPVSGSGEEDMSNVPPASLTLPSRVAETYYELQVNVRQGPTELTKHTFPVPLTRYDTLSSFGMYNRPETQDRSPEHLVTLSLVLERWSFGPNDTVDVAVRLTPNPDRLEKAKKVSVSKIVVAIEEAITYNPQGDEPSTKVKQLISKKEVVGRRLPENGYDTRINMKFPTKDLRDSDGYLPPGKAAFPMYEVSAFTTSAKLYKIDYFLTVKAHMSSCRDITLRQKIVVSPFDHKTCLDELPAIQEAARMAFHITQVGLRLPAPIIIYPGDTAMLKRVNMAKVGHERKLIIQ